MAKKEVVSKIAEVIGKQKGVIIVASVLVFGTMGLIQLFSGTSERPAHVKLVDKMVACSKASNVNQFLVTENSRLRKEAEMWKERAAGKATVKRAKRIASL